MPNHLTDAERAAIAAFHAAGNVATVLPPGPARAPATSPFRDDTRAATRGHIRAMLADEYRDAHAINRAERARRHALRDMLRAARLARA